MKKTENFCIRALCAIFVGVVLGCSGGGGEGGEMGGGSGGLTGGEPTADICGLVHEDIKHPTYMNVTNEFEGQRFIESNADWFYDGQYDKNTKFDSHYDDADKYINCKVAELNKMWQENDTGSTLSNQIGTALQSFNNDSSISQNIDNHYTSLAPVFNTMQNIFINDNDVENFHRFNVSYQKLAARAYNQSLGDYKGSTGLKSNMEMRNKTDNFFVDELGRANLSYTQLTDQYAETLMKQYLSTIAASTNTKQELLKKVVELALVNESFYGLNDYARTIKVSNQSLANERSLDIFYDKITDQYNSMNYSLDDRTM